jgi:hypothetical protein
MRSEGEGEAGLDDSDHFGQDFQHGFTDSFQRLHGWAGVRGFGERRKRARDAKCRSDSISERGLKSTKSSKVDSAMAISDLWFGPTNFLGLLLWSWVTR